MSPPVPNNHLPIPPELQYLIEKREGLERRQQADRRQDEFGPLGRMSDAALRKPPILDELDLDELRQRKTRRNSPDRRS